MENNTPKFITQDESRTAWLKSFEARDRRRYFKSGFPSHDRNVGAFLRGSSILAAARPGIGKTSYLLSLAYRQITAGVRAFYCNLEMSVEQMWSRLACLHNSDLTLKDLNEVEMTDAKVKELIRVADELVNFSPLFFESTDFEVLVRAARDAIEPSSDSILLVDYIGLLTLKRLGPQERYWLISECAKQLKLLARALDIPVVSAVQLNRKIDDRKDKTPTLADLRDSGELENHADMVMALTRDKKDVLEIDILKNRHGPLTSYSLLFDGPRAAVEEFE